VTVDLYQMASPLGALGVFRRESSEGDVDITGATLAALSLPYQALIVKGDTYVKVSVYEGELTESAGRRLVQGLAASLRGESVMPEEFALLPEEGRVAGSEGYHPGSFLGLEELTDCVYADYERSEDQKWGGFVVLPAAADEVWDVLAGRWESREIDGGTILYREVPYSGLVGVTRTDSGMFGVWGAADETELGERLAIFTSLR